MSTSWADDEDELEAMAMPPPANIDDSRDGVHFFFKKVSVSSRSKFEAEYKIPFSLMSISFSL